MPILKWIECARMARSRFVSADQCVGLNFFHDDRGPITENLSYAGSDLRRVITHADDGVGPERNGVLAKEFERILARPFTKICVDADVTADQGLKRCANVPDNAARTDDDTADQTQMPRNTIAVESESSCAKKGLHGPGFISNRGRRRRFSQRSTCGYSGAPSDLRILSEGECRKILTQKS
jgi:hypothetical protein